MTIKDWKLNYVFFKYIRIHYQENPDTFVKEIGELNQLREVCLKCLKLINNIIDNKNNNRTQCMLQKIS